MFYKFFSGTLAMNDIGNFLKKEFFIQQHAHNITFSVLV